MHFWKVIGWLLDPCPENERSMELLFVLLSIDRSIHPSIHFVQLFWALAENIVSTACPVSSRGHPTIGTYPERLTGEAFGRNPD